jgi:hypothetical protein
LVEQGLAKFEELPRWEFDEQLSVPNLESKKNSFYSCIWHEFVREFIHRSDILRLSGQNFLNAIASGVAEFLQEMYKLCRGVHLKEACGLMVYTKYTRTILENKMASVIPNPTSKEKGVLITKIVEQILQNDSWHLAD